MAMFYSGVRSPHRDGSQQPVPGARASGRAARGVLEFGRTGCALAGAQGDPALRVLRRRNATACCAQDAGKKYTPRATYVCLSVRKRQIYR